MLRKSEARARARARSHTRFNIVSCYTYFARALPAARQPMRKLESLCKQTSRRGAARRGRCSFATRRGARRVSIFLILMLILNIDPRTEYLARYELSHAHGEHAPTPPTEFIDIADFCGARKVGPHGVGGKVNREVNEKTVTE